MVQSDRETGQSYFAAYARRRNNVTPPDALSREGLLTDRGAYLNFLEIQLERASEACRAFQSIAERTSIVEQKVRQADIGHQMRDAATRTFAWI